MILIPIQDQHISGGDLIRLLDAECQGEEERLLRSHLAACTECKRRYDRRARVSERFSLALMDLEESLPSRPVESHRRRGRHSWLVKLRSWWSRKTARVLAVALVILAVGGAVTPVRAWFVAGLRTLGAFIGIEPGADAANQDDAPVVHFAVFGDEVLIEFTTNQSSGTLSLTVDTVTLASARILGDRGHDELSVLRSGLRIDNSARSSASYEVTIPDKCTLLEVRIAGRVVARYEVAPSARWAIDLASTGRTER